MARLYGRPCQQASEGHPWRQGECNRFLGATSERGKEGRGEKEIHGGGGAQGTVSQL